MTLPSTALLAIQKHLLHLCTQGVDLSSHFCSAKSPCFPLKGLLADLYSTRTISSAWNTAFLALVTSSDHSFFSRVEAAYYPHPWHVSTKVRRAILHGHHRIFHTINTENGDRGVYTAYQFGSREGCEKAERVVVKAWTDPSDLECATEATAYNTLSNVAGLIGVPKALHSSYDSACDVYAVVIEKLGPTLEDIRELLPDGRFTERMVLAVAIQMLDRYQMLHSLRIVHNGIKPANICISSNTTSSTLYAIDFGLSLFLDSSPDSLLPSVHENDAIGNRRFFSIFGHHCISLSQRDDLESLAYLVSYLYHGSLPWDLPRSSKGLKQRHPPSHVWRIKMATPACQLFRDMDPAFCQFLAHIKSLAFREEPDYVAMKALFEDCWKRRQYTLQPGAYDWWDLYNLLKAGTWPGEARVTLPVYANGEKLDIYMC